MESNWAFAQLNQLISPDQSPPTGPNGESERSESSLSFPISGAALQAQLEAWTNVAFDFDSISPANSAANSDYANVGQSYGIDNYDPLGLHHHSDEVFNSLLGGGPRSNAALDPYLPTDFLANKQSAVDPALALPPFPSCNSAAAAADKNAANRPSLSSKASSTSLNTTAQKKRRPSTSSPPVFVAATPPVGATDDELNALAVEEDKRRRNTAASARFRIKKKQREAALESTAKELRDKVSSLEREVEALKTENGWLRGLIVGKEESERKIREEEEAAKALAQKRPRIENDGEQGPEQEQLSLRV